MPGAGAELPARLDLATLTDVPAEPREVLVVDMLDVVDAELADLSARREAPTPTAAWATATGSSATTGAGTASTTVATAFSALTLRTALASLALGATEAGALRSLTTVIGP